MPYVRKTRDRWDIEVHYFGEDGWDVECSEYTGKDAYKTMCEYMENSCGRYSVRIRKHRERIEVPQKYPHSNELPPFEYDITQSFDWEGDTLTTAIATRMKDNTDRVVLQHYQTNFAELREFLDAKRAGLKLIAIKPGYERLIDADALRKEIQLLITENMLSRDDARDLLATIDEAPTIVPADTEAESP